ncbi:Mitochondrial distribution and morphology protein 10 [Ophidiomyces ophidiicola]|uniref:Mitochondrial distribution and morphology protein 10 n=1 Tax=Ophidiomyces ophidiicola TaxID=1387563 RepID=UPI0020C2B985|nr:Mitochondrial distribution and morphology protein 10 [Ophidiomyces ophidiicola]KAI1938887.1 Mitochondrial distribution and morphology protein 10 [Ophidiomyces ophidiicola]KAI2060027.1 Mitochondrial distribution and morphology protein 10 [Ophidiomyces ophidiicola]
MLDFMEYIQLAFDDATCWNRNNSYTALTDTANALLDFYIPERFRVHLSSLSTPQFATAYTLGTVGLIDGSISYLFSTLPLSGTPSRSTVIPLRRLVPGYKQIYPPSAPAPWDPIWVGDSTANVKDDGIGENKRKESLFHATLHLPPPTTLNGLFLRRLSPTTRLSLAICSTQATQLSKSIPQASVLGQLSHDTGKYSAELLFSTDNALLGFKGLWNFGLDPRNTVDGNRLKRSFQSASLISAGGEMYYSPLSSVVGISTGIRFTTLPPASEAVHSPSSPALPAPSPISTFPYTLTLTLTPLTGSLSTTYSLLASPNLAFSSRFGFNVYSWESEMVAGCELWRRKRKSSQRDNLAWAKRKMGLLSPLYTPPAANNVGRGTLSVVDESDSVIKLRVDQSLNFKVLWEGRVKDLLVSAGVGLGPSATSISPSAGSTTYGWTSVGVSVLYST